MSAIETDVENILVIDDHPAFLEGLFALIHNNYPDINIQKASSCVLAKQIIDNDASIDCIFLDYHLPDQDGIGFLKQLRDDKNTIPVVLLTADDDIALVHRALESGAMGFLLKSSESSIYRQCIETVCGGDIYLEPHMHTSLAQFRVTALQQINQINSQLTERQKGILGMLEKGFQNKDISDMLGLSVRTVKADISVLFEVFEVKNRSECVAEARQLGII